MADDSPPSTPLDEKPLLFISHRHDDKGIADVLRRFIISRTANHVAVFQSSSAAAEAPHPGKPLNEQLMDVLWHTDVFLLLYTEPERDWSYCTWEYGVALDDHKPDAKPILFQFSDRYPALFADQARVDIRKHDDIQMFTKDLLTAPDFFPNHPGSATAFARDSEEVTSAGNALYESLLAFALTGHDPEPWPPYPYLQMVIDRDHIARIRQAPANERALLTRGIVENEALVTNGDAESGRLFGKRARINDVPFKELLERWRREFPDSNAEWVGALSSQICSAAVDEFPTLVWELMRATDRADGTWYAPAVIKVQTILRRNALAFDVCFLKFALDENGGVVVGMPKT